MQGLNLLAAALPNVKVLWYITRATGIVSLMLMGIIILLGLATATKLTPKGFGKLVGPDLHRRLSITTLAFLGVHIASAILDPFVVVGFTSSVVPFVAKYRPLWVGLGTVSFDLLIVVIATSVIRHKFNHGIWKKIHYLSWAIISLALFHALGTGSDTQVKVVEIVYVALIFALGIAGTFRSLREYGFSFAQKITAGAGLFAVPLLLLVWATQGPLRVGWAKAANSFSFFPNIKLASTGSSVSTSTTVTAPTGSFTLPVSGTVTGSLIESQTSSGLAIFTMRGSVAGTPDKVAVQLNGSVQEGSLVLESSSAFLGTSTVPNLYTGTVSQASGATLVLSLTGPNGTVTAQMNVTVSGTSFTGTFSAPVTGG